MQGVRATLLHVLLGEVLHELPDNIPCAFVPLPVQLPVLLSFRGVPDLLD